MLVIFTKNDFRIGVDDYSKIESLNKKGYDLAVQVPIALSFVDGDLQVVKNRTDLKPSTDLGIQHVLSEMDEAEKNNELEGFRVL